MGVLKFDGVDDRLKWTTLAQALKDVSDGAWTMAVLFRAEDRAGWDALAYLLSGTGTGTAEAGATLSNPGTNGGKVRLDVGGTIDSVSTFTNTTNTYLLVVSKGAGTVTPRLGWKAEPAGAWTHENFGATLADQIDATMLEIGAWQNGDFFDGWIGVVAFWEGAMSDAHKEALDDNWATSDWWNSAHGQPTFLAELNVAGASVVDLAGNASSLTATGTSLDAAETLDDWNFDGTGAGGGIVSLACAIAGQATLAAELAETRALEAAIAGTGTLTGELAETRALEAAIAGTGTLTGELAGTRALEAAIAGAATLAAELTKLGEEAVRRLRTLLGVGE